MNLFDGKIWKTGAVVIPKYFRDKYGLRPGENLRIGSEIIRGEKQLIIQAPDKGLKLFIRSKTKAVT